MVIDMKRGPWLGGGAGMRNPGSIMKKKKKKKNKMTRDVQVRYRIDSRVCKVSGIHHMPVEGVGGSIVILSVSLCDKKKSVLDK